MLNRSALFTTSPRFAGLAVLAAAALAGGAVGCGANHGAPCPESVCGPASEPDAGTTRRGAPLPRPEPMPVRDASAPVEVRATPTVEVSFLDRATQPCQDFYRFACGAWDDANMLKPGETSRRRRSAPQTEIGPLVVKLIDEAYAQRVQSPWPETRAIGNYYQACMEGGAMVVSRATLRNLLAMADGITNLGEFARISAEFRKRGAHSLFLAYANVDQGDGTRYLLNLDQGARVMPSRDYYLEPGQATLREQYRVHIGKLAALVGVQIDAEAVLRIETALAQAEKTLAERRDPVATFNPMTFAALTALAPSFPWRLHLDDLGFGVIETVNVRSPMYIQALETLLTTAPLADLKHYLRWHMLEARADDLDQAAVTEEFEFHARNFQGRTVQFSRRSDCLGLTEAAYGMFLSKRYVENHFGQYTLGQSQALIVAVKAAFRRRLMTLSWLDDSTRTEALAKLDAIVDKVGHPEVWPSLTAAPPLLPWLDEQLERSQRSYRGIVAALAAKVNRSSWSTTPITVNAYYNFTFNEIIMPAAILQPPYFDAYRPAVANFGAIGSVIGHELIHGFDDSGRRFNSKGILHNWWSPLVDAEAAQRSKCVSDYYGKQEGLPGKFIDGNLTLGENLADLGGLRLALHAFLQESAATPDYAGFTPRQQFFLSYAQLRCSQTHPDLLSNWLKTDPHSPDRARINAPLSHLPDFAEAFACPADSPMRAQPLCEIW